MKYAACAFGLLFFLGTAQAHAAAPANQSSEIRITQDGTFSAKNVVVMQKSESGSVFFSRVVWGEIFLRITVVAAPGGTQAHITKNNGGAAAYADIKVGDLLEVEGTLSPGADTLLINATKIRDLSLNVEGKTIRGTIKTITSTSNTFTLNDKNLGAITVVAPQDIQKGARTISLSELAVGDNVLSASGSYDYTSKTFTALSMEVYQSKSVFVSKNFQGILKSISGTALPVTAVVTVDTQDYTVYFSAAATVMSKSKAATSLGRYTVGDTVRFWGSIRPTNLQEIDASLIRNLTF
jgi:hypothetical protein